MHEIKSRTDTETSPLSAEAVRAEIRKNPFFGKRVRNFDGENPRKFQKISETVTRRSVSQPVFSDEAANWYKDVDYRPKSNILTQDIRPTSSLSSLDGKFSSEFWSNVRQASAAASSPLPGTSRTSKSTSTDSKSAFTASKSTPDSFKSTFIASKSTKDAILQSSNAVKNKSTEADFLSSEDVDDPPAISGDDQGFLVTGPPSSSQDVANKSNPSGPVYDYNYSEKMFCGETDSFRIKFKLQDLHKDWEIDDEGEELLRKEQSSKYAHLYRRKPCKISTVLNARPGTQRRLQRSNLANICDFYTDDLEVSDTEQEAVEEAVRANNLHQMEEKSINKKHPNRNVSKHFPRRQNFSERQLQEFYRKYSEDNRIYSKSKVWDDNVLDAIFSGLEKLTRERNTAEDTETSLTYDQDSPAPISAGNSPTYSSPKYGPSTSFVLGQGQFVRPVTPSSLGRSTSPELPSIRSSTPGLTSIRSSTPGLSSIRSSTPELPSIRSSTPGLPSIRSYTPGLSNIRSSTPELPSIRSSTTCMPCVVTLSTQSSLIRPSPSRSSSSPVLNLVPVSIENLPWRIRNRGLHSVSPLPPTPSPSLDQTAVFSPMPPLSPLPVTTNFVSSSGQSKPSETPLNSFSNIFLPLTPTPTPPSVPSYPFALTPTPFSVSKSSSINYAPTLSPIPFPASSSPIPKHIPTTPDIPTSNPYPISTSKPCPIKTCIDIPASTESTLPLPLEDFLRVMRTPLPRPHSPIPPSPTPPSPIPSPFPPLLD